MEPKTITTATDLSSASIDYNTAYVAKNIPFSLASAIAYHAELEAKCDTVIEKQDVLIRGVTQRCRDAGLLQAGIQNHVPLISAGRGQHEPALSAEDQAAFLDAVAPMASQAFILQASEDEAEDIEQYEFDIAYLRHCMRAVEDEIVKHDPQTPVEHARKMKFLAGLVQDGGEVDMDAFARLVEEGAEMLLTALGEVGFF